LFVSVAEKAPEEIKPTGPATAGRSGKLKSISTLEFPNNNPAKYWKQNPEEEKQVLSWVETSAPDTFNQTISTSVKSAAKKQQATREVLYHVKGTKNKAGETTNLTVTFVGVANQSKQPPDADYMSKDYMDATIEHAQSTPDKTKKDKLGAIRGLASVPEDEKFPVKYVILGYFETGTRNSEVDAIVPLPKSNRRILYTFRFAAKTNDVDVERIGEEDKEVKLDVKHLSLSRVSNFATLSNDLPKLRAWIHQRYHLSDDCRFERKGNLRACGRSDPVESVNFGLVLRQLWHQDSECRGRKNAHADDP